MMPSPLSFGAHRMPYATLLKPASLRIGNLSFEQGVRKPVTKALAEALEINPRFRVEMRGDEEEGAADVDDLKLKTKKTAVQARAAGPQDAEEVRDLADPDEVTDAIALLDADDDDAFLDSGLPNPAAVSKILGREVTAADIENAMARELKPRHRGATATAEEIAAGVEQAAKGAQTTAEAVAADRRDVDPAVWTPAHVGVIRLAAELPAVERIFVNAAIKKALCRDAGGDHAWQSKVRPYWGHDYHFHIRIRCPGDSPDCSPQPPVPPGDGCGNELDWWFRDAVLRPPPPKPANAPAKPRALTMAALPAACRLVLQAPSNVSAERQE